MLKKAIFSVLVMGQALLAPTASYGDTLEGGVQQSILHELIKFYPAGVEVESLEVSSRDSKKLSQCADSSIRVAVHMPSPSPSRVRITAYCSTHASPIKAQIKVSGLVPVLLAMTNVSRGNMLQGSDLEIRKIPISDYEWENLSKRQDAYGRVVKRTIMRHQPIQSRYLEKRYDILSGENFEIEVTRGGFSFSISAIALEDGVIGDEITARNISSQKEFSAIITGVGRGSIR